MIALIQDIAKFVRCQPESAKLKPATRSLEEGVVLRWNVWARLLYQLVHPFSWASVHHAANRGTFEVSGLCQSLDGTEDR